MSYHINHTVLKAVIWHRSTEEDVAIIWRKLYWICVRYHENSFWADSRFAPSQWETVLLCNGGSHWLGTSLESTLSLCTKVRKNLMTWTNTQFKQPWKICKIFSNPSNVQSPGIAGYEPFAQKLVLVKSGKTLGNIGNVIFKTVLWVVPRVFPPKLHLYEFPWILLMTSQQWAR